MRSIEKYQSKTHYKNLFYMLVRIIITIHGLCLLLAG